MNEFPTSQVHVIVIWEPMLPTDWARPGGGVLQRIHDSRAEQYWDPDHRFAKEFGKRMDSDPQQPSPHCCEDGGIPWDLVAIYPAQSRWDASLPRAVFVDGPVVEVKQQFRAALAEALLPPPPLRVSP